MNGEEKEEGEEEELKARDGQEGVGLSVPLCLLQPVSLLQHVVQVKKTVCANICMTILILSLCVQFLCVNGYYCVIIIQ